MEDKLYGKTIIWNGDSICAGTHIVGRWADRIAPKHDMIFKNYAYGGGTITGNPPARTDGSARHSVSDTLDCMYAEYPDADYIIFEGGGNDADLFGPIETAARLGHFEADDYGGDYDTETFCGALESIFYRAVKYWMGKKIGFIIVQKIGPGPHLLKNRRAYFDVAANICKKWGIPCLDLWHGCYLNPQLPWMYNASKTADENRADNTGFYSDGVHLTRRGYDYTSELVEEWLKTL